MNSNEPKSKCWKCGRTSDVVNMAVCPFCAAEPPRPERETEGWEEEFARYWNTVLVPVDIQSWGIAKDWIRAQKSQWEVAAEKIGYECGFKEAQAIFGNAGDIRAFAADLIATMRNKQGRSEHFTPDLMTEYWIGVVESKAGEFSKET